MEMKIVNRQELEQIAEHPFYPHTMLISICDVDKPLPHLENAPDFCLFLRFDDLYVPERIPTVPIRDSAGRRRFSWTQAELLADFVKEHEHEMKTIICQCEYGISRSAAVAAAILEYINGCSDVVFNDPKYHPNLGVYWLTLTALKQSYSEPMKQEARCS